MRRIFPVRTLILVSGDLAVFAAALWLALFIRNFEIPERDLLRQHLLPFALLFTVWTLLFIVTGLYENLVLVHRQALVARLALAQGINVLLAALFFFLVPAFGITPKTILLIDLLVSVALIVIWRLIIFPRLFGWPRQCALIIGANNELTELSNELATTRIVDVETLGMEYLESPEKLASEVNRRMEVSGPDLIILDTDHPAVAAALPRLYKSLFSGVSFVNAMDAYEDIFGRVPLALMSDQWVVQHVPQYEFYDGMKRAFDVVVGGIGFICSLVFYPFIIVAIKLETAGPAFIVQERIGQHERRITLYKFRSMERNDISLGKDKAPNRVTRVGAFLRGSRLDELPQLFSVMLGDLSLIGPRPELPAGVALYEAEISYYAMRHLIKPGLSGWAQLYHNAHPHHVADVAATKEKLSYDLYYLKHRSFVLDLVVVLKTVRKLVMQSGK